MDVSVENQEANVPRKRGRPRKSVDVNVSAQPIVVKEEEKNAEDETDQPPPKRATRPRTRDVNLIVPPVAQVMKKKGRSRKNYVRANSQTLAPSSESQENSKTKKETVIDRADREKVEAELKTVSKFEVTETAKEDDDAGRTGSTSTSKSIFNYDGPASIVDDLSFNANSDPEYQPLSEYEATLYLDVPTELPPHVDYVTRIPLDRHLVIAARVHVHRTFVFVKRQTEQVRLQALNEFKIARKQPGLKYKLFNNATPKPIKGFPSFPGAMRSKISSKKGHQVFSADTVHLGSVSAKPSMRYFTHMETNIAVPDNLRCTNIPYLDEDQKDAQLAKTLLTLFHEGVHGVNPGCEENISDYSLYLLYKHMKTSWAGREMIYIHMAIAHIFPNKYGLRQICVDKVLEALYKRFDPIDCGNTPSVSSENFNVNSDKLCPTCRLYSCPAHWNLPASEMGAQNTLPRKEIQKFIVPDEACGENCYVNQIQNHCAVPRFDNSAIMDLFVTRITICGAINMCQISKKMNMVVKKYGVAEINCNQWHQLAKHYNETFVPGPAPERELPQLVRYKAFTSNCKTFDNNEVNVSCSHDGPCKDSENCRCHIRGVPCTKRCKCSVNCTIKFPGCTCTPGMCRANQCACFLAKWECDPDTCKSCNCDPLNLKRNADGNPLRICQNIMLQCRVMKKLKLGVSPLHGYGCFISGTAEKDDFITEYTGEIMSIAEAERRGQVEDTKRASYIFDLSAHKSVDAGRTGNLIRFANCLHENQNCRAQIMIVNGQQRIALYAKRRIEDGEELFFDYNYTEDNHIYVSNQNAHNGKVRRGKPLKAAQETEAVAEE